MGTLVRGDVVVIPFPFSDLSTAKQRPALVVASLQGDDAIFCQITSNKTHQDDYSVGYVATDFYTGTLPEDGHIRPNRLFTGEERLVTRHAGRLEQSKINEVMRKLQDILQN